jgi:hypothetical protein
LVPPTPGDTCPVVSRGFTPPDLANEPGAIIALQA